MKLFRVILFLAIIFVSKNIYAQKKIQQPNIIFILSDDLGYADIGCYGQQKTETPNIDKFCKEGLKFTQFYSGSTVCAPARTTLMTGLTTGHTPIRGNKTFDPEGQTPLADSIVTFVKILQQHGYSTGAFGKWSLGFITTSGDPNKKGFDTFFGYNCQTLAHDYYPDHLWSNHNKINYPNNLKTNANYSADIIHAEAIKFINAQQKNKPFFLYLPYTLPHADVIVPHDSVYNYYIKKFNEQPVSEKNVKSKKGKISFEPYPHAAYAAMVSRLDKYVAEILNTVNKKGFLENTLIIFCSDNGPHIENGGDPEFFQNHGILRGIKRDLYEGGIRVPFIAYWKGKIKAGVTEQPIALWDMYPTFLQVAGMQAGKGIDGISILPTLLKKGIQPQHNYFYWEFHENNGRQALRWKNWKLIKLNVNDSAKTIIELYDLSKDVSEKNDVSKLFPEIKNKLNDMIQSAHKQNTDWPLLPNELLGKKMTND